MCVANGALIRVPPISRYQIYEFDFQNTPDFAEQGILTGFGSSTIYGYKAINPSY